MIGYLLVLLALAVAAWAFFSALVLELCLTVWAFIRSVGSWQEFGEAWSASNRHFLRFWGMGFGLAALGLIGAWGLDNVQAPLSPDRYRWITGRELPDDAAVITDRSILDDWLFEPRYRDQSLDWEIVLTSREKQALLETLIVDSSFKAMISFLPDSTYDPNNTISPKFSPDSIRAAESVTFYHWQDSKGVYTHITIPKASDTISVAYSLEEWNRAFD